MPISDERRRELESALARDVAQFNSRTRRRILELIGDPPNLDNLTPEVYREIATELQQVLQTPLERTFIEASSAMMASSGFTGVSVDVINQGAVEWARNYVPRIAGDMVDYRREVVQKDIVRFFEGEIDRAGLTERVGRLYSPAKAEQIAVTETTRAANEGQKPVIDELSSQGVTMRGVWQTGRDELVCPICAPLDGKRSETTGSNVRFDGMGLPPAHVNCRCVVSFEYDEPIEGA